MAEEQTEKEVVVIYNGLNEHTLTADAKTRLRLIPGANIVSVGLLEKIKKGNEAFEHLEEVGQIDVIHGGAVKKDPDTGERVVEIPKMSLKEVKSVVESEADLDVLKGYMDQEKKANSPNGRPGVMKTIQDHMAALIDAANKKPETEE